MTTVIKSVIIHRKTSNFNKCIRRMYDQTLKDIFLKSVEAVQPQALIKNEIEVSNRHLLVRGQSYPLRKPCYVVGFGKAVFGMAIELQKVLGNCIDGGVVTIPTGMLNIENNRTMLNSVETKINFIEGAHNNLPDVNAMGGAKKIKELIENLKSDDLLIVLISGGGSALLPLPISPVSLNEKYNLITKLAKRGANIKELNTVRKRISLMKGGGLAQLAFPCKVISLILSDIVGDPLDFIASAPTTPNNDNESDAIEIIKKFSLYDETPNSIKQILHEGNQSSQSVAPIVNGKFEHVENFIIGNNKIATQSAKNHASILGFQSTVLSTEIEGEVGKLSEIYADIARNVAYVMEDPSNKESLKLCLEALRQDLHISEDKINEIINMDFSKEICLILAGEPTVEVKGNGRGGRNQQLALAFSVEVNKLNIKSAAISFLSCGTDGIDGPTDAAGAIGTSDLVDNSLQQNIKPTQYLDNNDSYSFYSLFNGGDHLVKTGHTGTNVMDIHILIIAPK